jgi:hypothetical protein
MKRGAVTTSVTINRHFSLFVSGNRSLTDHRWFTGGFAGLAVNIGPRDMVNVSAERDGGISRSRSTCSARCRSAPASATTCRG